MLKGVIKLFLIHSSSHLCFALQVIAKMIPQAHLVPSVCDQNEIISLFLCSWMHGCMVKDSALGNMLFTGLASSQGVFLLARRRGP